MASPRAPERPSAGRRRVTGPAVPQGADAVVTARDLLLKSWAGRLFIISAALKLIVAIARVVGELPGFLQVVSVAASIGLAVSIGHFVWRLFVLVKRRLLWRVRRKLILSYIFIGVVPALLIVVFFLLGGLLIFINVSAYLFKDGYDAAMTHTKVTADTLASELGRTSESPASLLARVRAGASQRYRGLSLAYVPVRVGEQPVTAGTWQHAPVPSKIPAWLKEQRWAGTVSLKSDDPRNEIDLVIRSVAPVVVDGGTRGYVVADLPLDLELVQEIQELTGVKAGAIAVVRENEGNGPAAAPPTIDASRGTNSSPPTFFRWSIIFVDCHPWDSGALERAKIFLSYRVTELYSRLSGAQHIVINENYTFGEVMFFMLAGIAGLFLIIEFVALIMGLALARSMTSSVHELFMGTERVRHGDFGHRININTKDQLGELAQSFNLMTGSIEGLLQTAAEKKRLEEELRIARQIQMSLLPRGPLSIPGLAITALCVPAREVGGDYYDFFPLSRDRLGVLIADVSGKGTSAALYMAELKGVVLALSQRYDSPRDLLIEVNRIISENLDSRSFITVTYAVIDLRARLMTYCRAGHTPLVFLPASDADNAQVLTPSGLVLGLRIEGAAEKFEELLEEDCISLGVGDVVVLYTDGITEAMNAASELFGEPRLSRIVEEHGHLNSTELRERILREIEAFVDGADQHDDMTMVLMKVEQAVADRVAV
jgi:phosphoserine phosphatase RsbU/P